MLNVYDFEKELICKEIAYVQQKWWGKPNSAENMERLSNEIIGRLEDLGFIAQCDPTPTLEGMPVDVVIVARTDKHEFDYEKKAYEVKQGLERNEDSADIEGAV